MNKSNFEILSNDLVNQPITIALVSAGIALFAALVRYFWKRKKPKITIEARCSLQDGERGLSIKVVNYSDLEIRIDTLGYDIFGSSNPNQCISFIKNQMLEPKSSYEKFIEEKNLHLESMEDATILFLKDQIGRLWKAPTKALIAIQRYNEFRKQYMQESL